MRSAVSDEDVLDVQGLMQEAAQQAGKDMELALTPARSDMPLAASSLTSLTICHLEPPEAPATKSADGMRCQMLRPPTCLLQ